MLIEKIDRLELLVHVYNREISYSAFSPLD